MPASQAHPTLHPNRTIHRAHGGPPDRVELLQYVRRTCHGLISLISDTTGKSLPGPSWRLDAVLLRKQGQDENAAVST